MRTDVVDVGIRGSYSGSCTSCVCCVKTGGDSVIGNSGVAPAGSRGGGWTMGAGAGAGTVR